jgi:hypothetical protein
MGLSVQEGADGMEGGEPEVVTAAARAELHAKSPRVTAAPAITEDFKK